LRPGGAGDGGGVRAVYGLYWLMIVGGLALYLVVTLSAE
jgi:hypothetical protein